MDQLDTRIATGRHPYSTLDWLHGTTGFPWSRCAEILRARGLAVDDGAIEMLRRARRFWDRLDEFRPIYGNAVRLRQVAAAEGDWAIVEEAELQDWLPGLHVPHMHVRETFLVRVVLCGWSHDLDFHSFPNYLPLFRVSM